MNDGWSSICTKRDACGLNSTQFCGWDCNVTGSTAVTVLGRRRSDGMYSVAGWIGMVAVFL